MLCNIICLYFLSFALRAHQHRALKRSLLLATNSGFPAGHFISSYTLIEYMRAAVFNQSKQIVLLPGLFRQIKKRRAHMIGNIICIFYH